MKRTILTPEQSEWLAETIKRNRRFAGMRMGPDDDADKDKGGDGDDADKDKGGGKDTESDTDKLGEGGKKALEAERTRAKNAEDLAKAATAEFDGFKKALLEGLGIKTEDGDKGEDALSAVQAQLATMQHESSVLKLANEHKITDKDDLELLGSAKDPEAMKKLAERLAPAEGDDKDATSRRGPKPDRSQGGGSGGDEKQSGGRSVAQVQADRRAAREAKNKTTS